MELTLKQANAIQALARCVVDFLPGSGARQWKAHVTFGTVAERAGVAEFWRKEGSKVPRLVQLFENTLRQRPQYFERLVIGIVKEGLRYRSSKGAPITPDEITVVAGHVLDIGFKFPDLWDEAFLKALSEDDVQRAEQNVERARRESAEGSSDRTALLATLNDLKGELEHLSTELNRQKAGYALEKLLNRLFEISGLAPRKPFKIVGEQIDGSFVLDHEVYLLEAKWEKEPIQEHALLVFRGKIEKSSLARGVFLSMNGITQEAHQAITFGKQATFLVMTGHDVMMILQGALPLQEFLRRRVRLLAEEAAVAVPFARVE